MQKQLKLLAMAAAMLLSTAQADALNPDPSLQLSVAQEISSEFTCKVTYDHIVKGWDYEEDDSDDCLGKKYDRDSYYPPFWGGDAKMKWLDLGKLDTELQIQGAAATDSDDLLLGLNPDWDSKIEIQLTKTYVVTVTAADGTDWKLDIFQDVEGFYILQNEMGPETGNQHDGAVWADNFQVALWENAGGTLPDGSASPNYTFNPAVDVQYYSADVTPELVCPDFWDPWDCYHKNWKKEKRFQAERQDSISGTGGWVLRLQVSFSLGAFSNHGCTGVFCNSYMGGEESAVIMGISDVIPHVKPDYPTASGVGGGHKNPVTADNGPGADDLDGGWNIYFRLNDITPSNTPPVADDDSYNAIEDTVLVVPAATGVLIGDTDADGDPLTAVKDSGPANGSLTLNSNGSFSYTPNANYCGADSFTYHAYDGTADSSIATVSLSVACVNDVPSFTKGANQTVLEDAAAQSVANWATNLSTGPANESVQTLSFNVSNSNNSLFSAQPNISPTGTLTYTPAADANGSATVTVAIKDSGGGTDTSASQTFNIGVTAVNDEPSFTHGGKQTVAEDTGDKLVAVFAIASPGGGSDESEQTFTYSVSNNNITLFSAQPAISPTGTLTYTSVLNAFGSATVTVSVTDSGGTANGGDNTSPAQTFDIEVTPVNDAPSFTVEDPPAVDEDTGPHNGVTITSAYSPGPANEAGQKIIACTLSAYTPNGLLSADPTVAVNIAKDGCELSYNPADDAFGTVTFKLAIQDDGGTANGGIDTSAAQTVTITVDPVNDPPVITSVADVTSPYDSQTSDYSDEIETVTIKAYDIDSDATTLYLALSASPLPSALPDPSFATDILSCSDTTPTITGAGQSCTWTMDGQILDAALVYDVVFTANDGELDNDCSGDPAVCTYTLTVQAEPATAELDVNNPIDQLVAGDGEDSGPFSLLFSAWEFDNPDDGNDGTAQAGNLNNMLPYMKLVPVGPGPSVLGVCDFTGDDPLDAPPVPLTGSYDETAYFECQFDEVPVNTYEIDAGVNGDYYTGFDEGVFVVYDPSLGFTTGGGFFYWPDTCAEIEEGEGVCDPDGYLGDKTNFGFTFKYNKKRKNIQGSLLMMRHTPEGNYKVKSNAIDGMGLGDEEDLGGTYGWAAITGKATFRDPSEYNTGGKPFLFYVEDHDDQGCNQDPIDEIWIEVDAENVWSDPLGPNPALDNPKVTDLTDAGDDEPIFCGNIVVPHETGGGGDKGKPDK